MQKSAFLTPESCTDYEEIGPAVPGEDLGFFIFRGRNCLGQIVLVYAFDDPIDLDLLALSLEPWGCLVYPLGEAARWYRLDALGQFQLSGVVGRREFRLTLRMAADKELRRRFETALAKYAASRRRPGGPGPC